MGSLGGSSSTKPDKYTKEIIDELMSYGKEVGKIPYQPWTGIDVAGFNPQQQAAMQSFADMGNAFGMGMPTDVMQGMPTEYTDASGTTGYSGFPAWMQNLEANRNTAAAGRYSGFYDLPVEDLYGKGNVFGSVTGMEPANSDGTPGGKGTAPGTGTGTGTVVPAPTTGGKAQPNTGIGNLMAAGAGTLPIESFLNGFRR
jgi:hypothetical protein